MIRGSLILWLVLGCCAFTIDWGLSWLLSLVLVFFALIGGILVAVYNSSVISRVSRSNTLNLSSFNNAGISAVSEKMIDLVKENDSLANPDDEIIGIPEVDAQLNLVLDYMIRDYVVPWSRRVSCTGKNNVLDESLKQKLRNAFANFAVPFLSIDWVDYFTAQLVDDFVTHLHLYRIALERVKQRRNPRLPFGSDDDLIEEAFFEAEAELGEPNISREAVSRNPAAETFYFEGISDILLSQVIPGPEFESTPFRLLGRSVLVWAVLRPTLAAIASPDLFNRNVIWLCRGTPISADHFTVIARTSTNSEELTAVLERVSFELSRCHALDALTESHELREQLAALYQLQQVCDRRLLELQMPRTRSSAMTGFESSENLTGEQSSKPSTSVSAFGLSNIGDHSETAPEGRNSTDSGSVFLSAPLIQDQMLITLEPNLLKFNDILNNPTLLDQFTAFVKKRKMYQYLTFILNAQAFATSFSEAIHRLSAPTAEFDTEPDVKSLSLNGDSVSLFSYPDTRSLPGGLSSSLSKSTAKSLAQMVSNNAGTLFENYLSPRADSSQSLRLDESMVSRTYKKIEKTIGFLQNVENENVDVLQTIPTDLFTEVTAAALSRLETRAMPAFRKELDEQMRAEHSSSLINRTIFGSEDSVNEARVDGRQFPTSKSCNSLSAKPNFTHNRQISAKIIDANKVLTNTESFAVYVIRVCSLVYRPVLSDSGDGDGEMEGKVDGLSWNTTRRYRDFAELHAIVKDRFPGVAARLRFPKKLLFNNLSDEVITKRMRELGDFLSDLLRETTSEGDLDKEAASSLKMMLLLFLQPGPWDRCGDTSQSQFQASSNATKRSSSQTTQQNSHSQLSSTNSDSVTNSDSPANKLINGANNRLGQMFKAIKNIPDRVDRTVDKLLSFMDLDEEPSKPETSQQQNSSSDNQPPITRLTSDRTSVYKFVLDDLGVRRSDSSHTGLGGNDGPGVNVAAIDPSLNIPMRILMRLGHEVFDLGSPRHDWLRTQFADILSSIIASTKGTSMNKKIVSQVEWLTSREQVVNYVKAFRDLMWPNGRTAASSLADDPSKPQPTPTRHPHSLLCARMFCKTRMMGVVPDEIRTILSAEATREAIVQLFELFQHPTLNRRLVIVIFEGLLRRLYPQINFEEVFRRLHQNAKLRAGCDSAVKAGTQMKSSSSMSNTRDQASVLPNGTSNQQQQQFNDPM